MAIMTLNKSGSLKSRQVFAVQTGDYVGQMFIVIEIKDNNVLCLSVPEMTNISVPIQSFDFGRNNDIIKYVETLPKDVFKVTKAQFLQNENTNNRWK